MAEDPTNGDNATDYEVGYGKPPKGTRWPKGVSGNPRGRPKRARGLKTDLRDELVAKMDIRMNGKQVSGTRQQLMLRTLTARAASGDVRATKLLVDLVMQLFGPEDHGTGLKRLSQQDQAILDELLARKSAMQSDSSSSDVSTDETGETSSQQARSPALADVASDTPDPNDTANHSPSTDPDTQETDSD